MKTSSPVLLAAGRGYLFVAVITGFSLRAVPAATAVLVRNQNRNGTYRDAKSVRDLAHSVTAVLDALEARGVVIEAITEPVSNHDYAYR